MLNENVEMTSYLQITCWCFGDFCDLSIISTYSKFLCQEWGEPGYGPTVPWCKWWLVACLLCCVMEAAETASQKRRKEGGWGGTKSTERAKDRGDKWVEEEKEEGEIQSWHCCHGNRRHLGEERNRTALGKDPESHSHMKLTEQSRPHSCLINAALFLGLRLGLAQGFFVGYKK